MADTRPKRRASSIRTRFSALFLLLLALVFVTVVLSFNLILNNYMTSEATRQLTMSAEGVKSDVLGPRMALDEGKKGPPDDEQMPDIMRGVNRVARRGAFVAQVQAVIIDENFEQAYPAEIDEPDDRNRALLDAVREQGISLDDSTIRQIHAGHRTYFVMPVGVEQQAEGEDAQVERHLLLFIDMTDVSNLSRTLNTMLAVIILVSVLLGSLLAMGMAARMARPIRQLSEFAAAIGRGEFKRREIDVRDRELIELRDAMNHAADQLGRYDSEQKTFFQNASHELRTPLMSIKGYAEGIQVGVFEDTGEAAGVIVSEADRMSSMVEDLLYLSRIDNITSTDQTSEMDARELLSDCGESLSGFALHEGVTLRYDFPGEPVLITGSEKALTRALTNVLSNALRYARDRVVISCGQRDAMAFLSVLDDGPGIAEDDISHIFERFYKGAGGKHGIGLSIAKAVVEQHKGTIRAENTGHGARFTIEIPLAE